MNTVSGNMKSDMKSGGSHSVNTAGSYFYVFCFLFLCFYAFMLFKLFMLLCALSFLCFYRPDLSFFPENVVGTDKVPAEPVGVETALDHPALGM